jgi:hypothetical protein
LASCHPDGPGGYRLPPLSAFTTAGQRMTGNPIPGVPVDQKALSTLLNPGGHAREQGVERVAHLAQLVCGRCMKSGIALSTAVPNFTPFG